MGKSDVFFTDFRTKLGVSQTVKLQKLCRAAGIDKIDFDHKFVAIKMHFGELGNCSYLRPNYVKAVADVIKELGGIPFLTDCNTLYTGSRTNAVDHLTNAEMNGFNSVTTGCHVIIADGLRGTDDIEIPVPDGEYCKTALVGRALVDADILISLSHFKGHEMTGFGGALKNIGMGGGSRTRKASPRLIRMSAAGASAVPENAEAMLSPMGLTARQSSTRSCARAAAAASGHALSTPLRTKMTTPPKCFAARWPNMPALCVPGGRPSISA